VFRHVCFVLILLLPAIGAETPTVYVGDRYEHRTYAIATDASGNTYVTGARLFKYPAPAGSPFAIDKSEVFVAKLDATNTRVWIEYFSGKDNDFGTAITTDASGNVFVAGQTSSPNFPQRNPIQSEPSGSFVLQLPPDGSRILWSTYYGAVLNTRITSIAVAPDGDVVVGGYAVTDSFQNSRAFVAKIDIAARRIRWEQQFGGTALACTGGSSCFLSPRHNSATIALDAAGNIYAAGNTNTLDFPTTTGAYLEKGYGPFVRKFSPSGTVLWSTYLTNNRVGMGYPVYPADTLTAFAVASDGSVYLAGGGSPAWPTTPGAYRTTYEGPEWPPLGPGGPPNPYVAKLNSAGTALVYSTFIGHNNTLPASIASDAAGSAYVNGPGDYITGVNPTGSALLSDTEYANGSRGTKIVIDTSGRIHAAGALGVITVMDRAPSATRLSGVANAAGLSVTGRVVAGELISIYGANLGNDVFVDELPAPVLSRSASQINAVVPFGVVNRERVTLTVRTNGAETAKAVLAITRANPEIFKLPDGQAAALNEDGTPNSADNPARPGSVISVWGTGVPWPESTVDGSVTPNSPLTYLAVFAILDGHLYPPLEFSGAAPGMVAGVFQMNIRVPSDIGPGVTTVMLYAMSNYEVSAPAYIYVRF
jgi:uncharacterized protein (TIGR03437 family)